MLRSRQMQQCVLRKHKKCYVMFSPFSFFFKILLETTDYNISYCICGRVFIYHQIKQWCHVEIKK